MAWHGFPRHLGPHPWSPTPFTSTHHPTMAPLAPCSYWAAKHPRGHQRYRNHSSASLKLGQGPGRHAPITWHGQGPRRMSHADQGLGGKLLPLVNSDLQPKAQPASHVFVAVLHGDGRNGCLWLLLLTEKITPATEAAFGLYLPTCDLHMETS